jgi:hypothetical protein
MNTLLLPCAIAVQEDSLLPTVAAGRPLMNTDDDPDVTEAV